jgi:hypothetical protein
MLQVASLQATIDSLQSEADSNRKRARELEEALGEKSKVCCVQGVHDDSPITLVGPLGETAAGGADDPAYTMCMSPSLS